MLPMLALALAPQAFAQEQPLPSVSDYRLPAPQPRATRAPGPVDPQNPVVPVRRVESSPAPAASASAAPSPAPSQSANPSPRPSASASRPAAPRRAEAPARDQADAREPAATRDSEPRATERQEPAAASAPSPAPAASSSTVTANASPPVLWNVHKANSPANWPWLLGIALLLASNAYLLFLLLRRRQRMASGKSEAEQDAPQPEAPATAMLPEPAIPETPPLPAVAQMPVEEPPAEEVPASRPALELVVNPIEVTLAARQMSATLMNTVLKYELVVANQSTEVVGPITIAGDMIGAHASLPTRAQLEIMGDLLEPHHRHSVLHPGEWAKFTGEFRLPLAAITPIRNGKASLFVPLARFRVEVARKGAPPLVVNRTFVIGETPDNPESALKPFRLDLGPRLYSQIGQREVAASA
ncbi:MAG: hypothetical protein AB7F98_12740 [Novosphingobium sp.]